MAVVAITVTTRIAETYAIQAHPCSGYWKDCGHSVRVTFISQSDE
jgi:hypothetical protein